jgi:hypothetical protein
MIRKYKLLFILTILSSLSSAQEPATIDNSLQSLQDDYYSENYSLKYDDRVYTKNVRSILFNHEKDELAAPILTLGGSDRLKLSFDELNGELKNYSFTLVHCNANWQPSGLMPMEYIDGFQDAEIIDFNYSSNTKQRYIHYSAFIPHPSMQITKSGNYLLKVYQSGNPEKLVLTRRFMVVENMVMVKAIIRPATTIEFRNYKQEVDFSIIHPQYKINNPFQNLHVVISQNNRWDNAITNLKPSFIKDAEITYNYDEDNVFSGGSEFRNLDLKSLRYQSERVAKIITESDKNIVILRPDERRSSIRYTFANDINGKFIVRTTDGPARNSDINADYSFVHFFVKTNEEFNNGNVYVVGAFNSWQCSNENKMVYNAERQGYQAALYLKQGFYNYQYVFVENGSTQADESVIEGMHQETENDYSIYVYYRPFGVFYDKLIGVARFNSRR